jgi:hypothetical protein
VTFGDGQPTLRSTWSTPSSSTSLRTAAPTISGFVAYSWMLRTVSSGPNDARRFVVSLTSSSARADTISLT